MTWLVVKKIFGASAFCVWQLKSSKQSKLCYCCQNELRWHFDTEWCQLNVTNMNKEYSQGPKRYTKRSFLKQKTHILQEIVQCRSAAKTKLS